MSWSMSHTVCEIITMTLKFIHTFHFSLVHRQLGWQKNYFNLQLEAWVKLLASYYESQIGAFDSISGSGWLCAVLTTIWHQCISFRKNSYNSCDGWMFVYYVTVMSTNKIYTHPELIIGVEYSLFFLNHAWWK